ncbi:MAG: glycine-rich domain-containing protein [Burkholderiales bacterium]
MPIAVSLSIIIFIIIAAVIFGKLRAARRADYIRSFSLPMGLYEKLRKRRPELTAKDCQLVGNALRQFFMTYLKSGRKFVAMPSQVVDELWHEFILYTKNYDDFCRNAFGRFMHHTPAVVMKMDNQAEIANQAGTAGQANVGLRRCWWYACREENINPAKPLRLPLLFALDAKLKIADGFHYLPNCSPVRRNAAEGSSAVYCGGDFSSAGIDGSTDGFGDSSSSSGSGVDSSSAGEAGGGGNSGGSCGGGGCGGGD